MCLLAAPSAATSKRTGLSLLWRSSHQPSCRRRCWNGRNASVWRKSSARTSRHSQFVRSDSQIPVAARLCNHCASSSRAPGLTTAEIVMASQVNDGPAERLCLAPGRRERPLPMREGASRQTCRRANEGIRQRACMPAPTQEQVHRRRPSGDDRQRSLLRRQTHYIAGSHIDLTRGAGSCCASACSSGWSPSACSSRISSRDGRAWSFSLPTRSRSC